MSRSSPDYGETVRVWDYRIESHYLRFVGDQLKRYWGRKQRLRELEEGVIKATSLCDTLGMPKGTDPGDPVHGAAIRLMDDREPTFQYRAHLRGWIVETDAILKTLPAEHQQIITLMYRDKRAKFGRVSEQLHLSPQSLNRKRNEALAMFAVKLIGEYILIPVVSKKP